jgi:hypothetical protein
MKDRPIINIFPNQEQKISDLVAINATIVGMGGSNDSVSLKAISKSGREFMVKATVNQIFQFINFLVYKFKNWKRSNSCHSN